MEYIVMTLLRKFFNTLENRNSMPAFYSMPKWHWHVTFLIKFISGFAFLRDDQTGKGVCAGPTFK